MIASRIYPSSFTDVHFFKEDWILIECYIFRAVQNKILKEL